MVIKTNILMLEVLDLRQSSYIDLIAYFLIYTYCIYLLCHTNKIMNIACLT